jgi:hypothetical protein
LDEEEDQTALSWGVSARETFESQHETISDENQSHESYPKNQQNSSSEISKNISKDLEIQPKAPFN